MTKLGNIVLSTELPIDDQIKKAIRTHRVTVLEYDGSLKTECPVLNFNTTDLVFPSEDGKLGSLVMLDYPEGSSVPVVMGIVPDSENKLNTIYQNEYQKKFTKQSENCVISVSEDALNGNINVSILGLVEGKSNFKINVGSVQGTAKAEIACQGEMNIRSTKNLNLFVEDEFNLNVRNKVNQEKFNNIKCKLGVGIIVTDEFDNTIITNADGVNILDKNKNNIKMDSNGVKIDVKGKADIIISGDCNLDVKGKVVLKSPDVKIEGGELTVGNIKNPLQGFCQLPLCVITGTPQTVNKIPSI